MASKSKKSTHVVNPIQEHQDTFITAFTFDTIWLANQMHNQGLLSTEDCEKVTNITTLRPTERSRILVNSIDKMVLIDPEKSAVLMTILEKKRKLYRTPLKLLKNLSISEENLLTTSLKNSLQNKDLEEPICPNNSSEIEEAKPKDKIVAINYTFFIQFIQFILVTTDDNEFNAATVFLKAPDFEKQNSPSNATKIERDVYIGMLGKHCVGLIQTRHSVEELIQQMKMFENAKFIISVGSCYGFPQQNLKMGDVIVSKKISNFGIIEFHDDVLVSPKDLSIIPISQDIYSMFRSNEQCSFSMEVTKGRTFAVHHGMVISSPSVIGNSKIRDKIYDLHSIEHPLGGETEGCELLKLQEQTGLHVIIVKSVSNFGKKTKRQDKKWQYTSSKAAIYYVKYMMDNYPVPEYPESAKEKCDVLPVPNIRTVEPIHNENDEVINIEDDNDDSSHQDIQAGQLEEEALDNKTPTAIDINIIKNLEYNLMISRGQVSSKSDNFLVLGNIFGLISFVFYVIAIAVAWTFHEHIFHGNTITLVGSIMITLTLLIIFLYVIFGFLIACYNKPDHFITLIILSAIFAIFLETIAGVVLIIAGSQPNRPSKAVIEYGISSGLFSIFAAISCTISTLFFIYHVILRCQEKVYQKCNDQITATLENSVS